MYKNPGIYEKVFSYRNLGKEISFICKILKRIKAKSVLDIGCGAGSHMVLLKKMGYSVMGIDNSEDMVSYCKDKGLKVHKKDMKKFSLSQKFDACISMLATFSYLLETRDIVSHLDSVARVLRKGGAYIVEMGNPFVWYDIERKKVLNEWQTDDLKAKMIQAPPDAVTQRVKWTIDIRRGSERIRQENIFRIMFPQELRTIVEIHGKFRLFGLFGDFNSSEFNENSDKMIAVLVKK